jgi:hypothetical protein
MESITQDDVQTMLNIHDHLDEQNVIEYFKVLVKREEKNQADEIPDIEIE